MGPQWMLWLLVLKFSTSGEAQQDAAGSCSTGRTDHHDNTPHTLGRQMAPHTPLLLANEEGQRRQPLQTVSEEGTKIWALEKYFRPSMAASRKTVNNLLRRKDVKEISLKTLRIHNTDDVPIQLNDAASLNQKLVGKDKQELRECDLVMAYSCRYSQLAVLRDLLLLRSLWQVKPINTREAVSSKCCGFPNLLGDPQPHVISASSYHDSWNIHDSGRRRRRSPAAGGGTNCDNCSLALAAVGGTYCDNCSLAFSQARNVDQDLTLTDLVSCLISLTSGRQFYLVYDDDMPGVEVVVRSFQEVMADTTLLPYDPNILLLTEVLTSNYHVQAMRNVFILCSATHIANIFDQVRDKVLESPTIQWIVIVDEDLTEKLPLLLREGTQVALVQRLQPQKTRHFSSRVDPDGRIRFHQVGSWSVSGTCTNGNQVKGGLVPDLLQLYSDFQGRQLLVTTNNYWPFFKIEELKNGTILPISGIDHSVMNTLSEKLNFTYRLVRPPDGKWGGPQPDGTVTGLVGMVARHEVHAAICTITITYTRETVVDFTLPYYLQSSTLVSPAPKEKNRSFAILSPFTVEVWLCIFVVTVLVGPLLYLVSRLLVLYIGEGYRSQYSLQSLSFNMYRNLVLQGNLINSHRWSLRFIFFGWYLFSFYMYAMYSGTLTAALAIVSYEKPIDSLFDLAQAHQDGYTIATTRDSSYVAAFKSAKGGIYKEVWQLFNHKDPSKSFLRNSDVGIELILKQKYVFITSLLISKVRPAMRGRENFYIARQTFLPQGYGIACRTGSPFMDIFTKFLLRLIQAGLVVKWENDEMNKIPRYISSPRESGPAAISLQHLQAAFFIMVLGFTISAVVLVMEVMASLSWQSIRGAGIEEVSNVTASKAHGNSPSLVNVIHY